MPLSERWGGLSAAGYASTWCVRKGCINGVEDFVGDDDRTRSVTVGGCGLAVRQASLGPLARPLKKRPDPRIVVVLGVGHHTGIEMRAALLMRHPLQLLIAGDLARHAALLIA
jgi:hypothetical protein